MKTRIITGVIGIAVAAFVIQTGGWLFAVAVLALMLIGWHEYAKAFNAHGESLAYFTGVLILLLMWGSAFYRKPEIFIFVSLLGTFAVFTQSVLCHRTFTVIEACESIAGIVYVGFAFSHLVLLRFFGSGEELDTFFGSFDTGCALIWIALIGTWASDTFAYFSGSAFGKNKLCEAISPKKTIEGFIGGVIGTMISVAIVGHLFSFAVIPMLGLGFLIALVATMGDLVESAIKRYTGIKDSGNIIPGHGGVLDRFDSVMFSVPFVYYFTLFVRYFDIL
ncbi:MAG: phosphatidate cytidylyltransferase [Selenomonadaceae bacterium]